MLLYIKFNFNLIALFYIGTIQEYQFTTAKLVWQNWKLVEYFKPLQNQYSECNPLLTSSEASLKFQTEVFGRLFTLQNQNALIFHEWKITESFGMGTLKGT